MAAHQLDLDNLHDVLPLRRLIISNNYDLQSRIDDLNDTLLELIFIRIVQWRHLVTCKCVSKRWNFIISNPDFARYLVKKHSPFTLILKKGGWAAHHCLITEHPYFQTRNIRLNDIIPIKIVANHNDILVDFRATTWRQSVYNISNPLTKQFIVVPLPSEIVFYYTSEQNCKIGFAGFVDGVSTIDNVPNSKNDIMGFRIIRAIMSGQNKLIWHIYSSETGKWKKYYVNDLGFKFKTDEICNRLDDQAVTLNNKIHWRGHSNKILVIDPFVVEDDNVLYCVLNLPSAIQEDSVLCSCRNRLRIAQLKSNKIGLRIKIWEFDDVYDDMINSGCNTMANVRLVINFLFKPNLIDRHFNPFHGEGLFSINLRCTQNKMICCHPNDPDTVYFVFKDKLVECDVVKSRLRVISDCTTTNWSRLFMLVHPLPALQ